MILKLIQSYWFTSLHRRLTKHTLNLATSISTRRINGEDQSRGMLLWVCPILIIKSRLQQTMVLAHFRSKCGWTSWTGLSRIAKKSPWNSAKSESEIGNSAALSSIGCTNARRISKSADCWSQATKKHYNSFRARREVCCKSRMESNRRSNRRPVYIEKIPQSIKWSVFHLLRFKCRTTSAESRSWQ